jgi:mRNA interferase RelE/StbE
VGRGTHARSVENGRCGVAAFVTICYIVDVQIRFTPLALRQFTKLDAGWRLKIEQKLRAYVRDPASVSGSVKRLVGDGRLRMRIGDYRVVFKDDGTVLMVEKVGHRSEVYRSR